MIERLIDLECPYGEPEYSKLALEINRLKQQLSQQVDQEGVRWLEQLADLYAQQETAVLRDAFADGFWSALELMFEFQRGRRT